MTTILAMIEEMMIVVIPSSCHPIRTDCCQYHIITVVVTDVLSLIAHQYRNRVVALVKQSSTDRLTIYYR